MQHDDELKGLLGTAATVIVDVGKYKYMLCCNDTWDMNGDHGYETFITNSFGCYRSIVRRKPNGWHVREYNESQGSGDFVSFTNVGVFPTREEALFQARSRLLMHEVIDWQ